MHHTTKTLQHLEFRTSDLESAQDHVSAAFASHELSIGKTGQLDFRLDIASTARLSAARMAYGTETTIVGPPMLLCYHINLPVDGESTVEQNGVRRSFSAGSAGVAFGPNAPVLIKWSADARQYHLNLPKDRLEAHAGKLIGQAVDEEIRFDLTFDLTAGPGRALLATTSFLYAELARQGGIAAFPAATLEFESAVMTQILMTVPNQFTPLLCSRPEQSGPSKIRELVEYIDLHAAEDITTADLVARAGVSARALQAGFRDVVGASPITYLRNVRLDRVHRELSMGTGSVSDIAARWHFYHPGRFASQYRERFGVLPSENLQRRRS
ncbi:AraC family transcriptional regulator [Arthrobacter sp. NPDC058097]|uniref:AraC family transcriptional regulator n=1 Tax=Arthrobacter sp. NPDC058097 TaxID=3346340 RepID=UPI0036D83E71